MSIPLGGIRAQIRKLSEIAPNFGHFVAIPNVVRAPLPKLMSTVSRIPRGTSRGKVS